MKGTRVIVFAEGPSDELFIKRVIAPSMQAQHIYLKPQTLNTSRNASGGAINFDRLKMHVRHTLRHASDTYLTTFFDLYALDSEMPGLATAGGLATPAAKASHIEQALHRALVDHAGCRPDRLLPHIQPYELEGLFFSSPELMAAVKPEWARHAAPLRAVRAAFETPEHINDGYDTKPSARLDAMLVPRYRKTSDAPLIGERIGLNAITAECPHFSAWVNRLQSLPPL